MRKTRFPTPVLLFVVFGAVPTIVAIAQEIHEPPGFLEVQQIVCCEVKLRLQHDSAGINVRRFNQGRTYAISINEHLPNARFARARLAQILAERKQSHKVVSEWFGKSAPKRLNIMIGSEIPVEIAQAVIAVYAVEAKLPVSISLRVEDAGFDDTRRVYIGALVDFGEDPMPSEKIRRLLKTGLTPEEFAKLLPNPMVRP